MLGHTARLITLAVLSAGVLHAAAPPGRRVGADPTKRSADHLVRLIDSAIDRRLKAEKVEPSPLCSDEEFVRRAYLDVAGKIPPAARASAFLDGKDPGKRARLIDDLLASPDYGRQLADVWQGLLLPRNSDNRRLMQWYPNLTRWLEKQFNDGAGWDRIAHGVLTVTGDVGKEGPGIYWLANSTPDKVTDNVTRMFMGVQLKCAQCHNHPFTDYKQNDYWHMAAFFMKVAPSGRPQAAIRNGGSISISERPRGFGGRRRLPESAKMLPPRFLQGEKPAVRANEPVRPVLADWLTGPKNPFFARAMVNRMWAHFFGRGLVNPVDDMHDGNPASHPELLAELAREFSAGGFDHKQLVRAICSSRTYQRSSKPAGNNTRAGPELFARMAVKPLTPGQLYDSLTALVGAPERRGGGRRFGGAGRLGPNPREAFVASFSAEDGADPTEYHDGIPQVLRLMNAPQLNNTRLLGSLMRDGKGSAETVEKLYLSVLARRPRAEELDRINAYLNRNKDDRRQAFAGVLWALMNSSEFRLNR